MGIVSLMAKNKSAVTGAVKSAATALKNSISSKNSSPATTMPKLDPTLASKRTQPVKTTTQSTGTSMADQMRAQNRAQQTVQPAQSSQIDYSYLVPLAQWFSGQNITNKNGVLGAGGFNFNPGSYESKDGQYMVNPLTLAGMYLNKPQTPLTSEQYGGFVDKAEGFYEPTRQARLQAMKDIMNERKAATRQSALSRGVYSSGTYGNDIVQNVEKPYAQEMSDFETNIASMVNQMAMDEAEKQKVAEQTQMQNIVNYLLNLNNVSREEDWRRTEAAAALQPAYQW